VIRYRNTARGPDATARQDNSLPAESGNPARKLIIQKRTNGMKTRNFFALTLATVFTLGLTACGEEKESTAAADTAPAASSQAKVDEAQAAAEEAMAAAESGDTAAVEAAVAKAQEAAQAAADAACEEAKKQARDAGLDEDQVQC
tara:strand:- start:523 stop:957 length:435 start_codon:yes stop_codon:yes gene_type:complete